MHRSDLNANWSNCHSDYQFQAQFHKHFFLPPDVLAWFSEMCEEKTQETASNVITARNTVCIDIV